MTILEVSISAGADDGYFREGAGYFNALQVLNLGHTDNTRNTFMRFVNITIPPRSTILDAYFEVEAGTRFGSLGSITNWIKAVDEDDSAAITSESDYNSRAKTTASVDWEPPAWNSGTKYQSPDISAIIQEIIDRAGWANGNALQVLWDGKGGGSGLIEFDSFESSTGDGPLLHIEHTPPVAVAAGWGRIPIGG